MNKNTICLWYNHDAEEAAQFYAKTFPNSSVESVHRAPSNFPGGKAGQVLTVQFTVCGIPCMGLNGGDTDSADHDQSNPDVPGDADAHREACERGDLHEEFPHMHSSEDGQRRISTLPETGESERERVQGGDVGVAPAGERPDTFG